MLVIFTLPVEYKSLQACHPGDIKLRIKYLKRKINYV